jgi:AraC-like DNA-binding protein
VRQRHTTQLAPLSAELDESTCEHGHAVPMTHAHRHDHIELNFAEQGQLVYLFGAEKVVLSAGTMMAFWGARPHQLIDCPPDSSAQWLTVPLPMMLRWELPAAFVALLLQGGTVSGGGEVGPSLDAGLFSQWSADLSSGSAFLRATAEMEIQARIRRLAHEIVAERVRAAPAVALDSDIAQAARMVQFIAEHFAEPLRAADIAHTAYVHPHHAMDLFRRVLGQSMFSYLIQYRVCEAQRLLLTSDLPVTEVGRSAGFGSQSQFYEAFSKLCGQPPGRYRRELRAIAPDLPDGR